MNQDALDLDDAPESQDRLPELFLRDERASKGREHRVELPQDLLEPQLVGLMDDDEEHLVVGGPAMEGALHLLRSEQPIELDVVRVVERAAGFFVFHLACFVSRCPERNKPSSAVIASRLRETSSNRVVAREPARLVQAAADTAQ